MACVALLLLATPTACLDVPTEAGDDGGATATGVDDVQGTSDRATPDVPDDVLDDMPDDMADVRRAAFDGYQNPDPTTVHFPPSTDIAAMRVCERAPTLTPGVTRVSVWREAVRAPRCGFTSIRSPTLFYAVEIPPGTSATVSVASLGTFPPNVVLIDACGAGSCLAFSRFASSAPLRYDNPDASALRVIVTVSLDAPPADGVLRVRLDLTPRVDADAAVVPDVAEGPGVLQPPAPLLPWDVGVCRPPSAPSLSPNPWWRVRFDVGGPVPAWSLMSGNTLWLSHPGIEGRTTLDLPSRTPPDLLVTRAMDGRQEVLATAEGVVAAPRGLVATTGGAVMVARVAPGPVEVPGAARAWKLLREAWHRATLRARCRGRSAGEVRPCLRARMSRTTATLTSRGTAVTAPTTTRFPAPRATRAP